MLDPAGVGFHRCRRLSKLKEYILEMYAFISLTINTASMKNNENTELWCNEMHTKVFRGRV